MEPTLNKPIVYDVGLDIKLAEFRGWTEERLAQMPEICGVPRFTVRLINNKWYAESGGACLRVRMMPKSPIMLFFGTQNATGFDTAEEALELFKEYLAQPINPYEWVNKP